MNNSLSIVTNTISSFQTNEEIVLSLFSDNFLLVIE